MVKSCALPTYTILATDIFHILGLLFRLVIHSRLYCYSSFLFYFILNPTLFAQFFCLIQKKTNENFCTFDKNIKNDKPEMLTLLYVQLKLN